MSADSGVVLTLGMNAPAAPDDAVPAATVILLRDSEVGPEVLMLRRNSALAFAGGAWVFPGGRVDPDDLDPAAPHDQLAAARNAAVREAAEEAAIELDAAGFVVLSRWCPPPEAPKRFDTWFFVAAAPASHEVTIDGGEIHDHAWIRPADALARRDAGEIELIPPTWVTLHRLAGFADVDAALADLAAAPVEEFVTRVGRKGDDGIRMILWEPDVAYDGGDVDAPGSRHRLTMDAAGWSYERSF